MLTLGHLFAALGDYKITQEEPAITSIVVDSRDAEKGSFFVAFPGENVDGHDYVADAFARGAAVALIHRPLADQTVIDPSQTVGQLPPLPFCILVDDTETGLQQIARYWRSHFDLTAIGITGSVGKTSTKELTHAVLAQRFNTLKSEGNRNNEIGLPLTMLELRPRHTHAVLEMGMYAKGEIATLCSIAYPTIGIVSNIGPVHMSRLGSMEAITEAKRELVEALPADGTAILNRDDERVMSMIPYTKATIFTYGLTPEADLWAGEIQSMGLQGIRCTLHHGREAWRVQVPLLGLHSVHTVLRATAAGLVCGMEWDEIIRGLQKTQAQLRLVTTRGPRNSTIFDDTYNASPDSVIAALNLLAEMDGKKIAVLGDMLELGSAEEVSHRLVGQRASMVVDHLVTIGTLGRIIGEAALAGGMRPSQVYIAADVHEAVEHLEKVIEPKDFVLVKGSLGARLDRVVAALSRTKGAV